MYDSGDVAMLANVGPLVEPITKAQYEDPSSNVKLPPSLFAHNVQQRVLQSLDPLNMNAKGVLGRTIDRLIEGTSDGEAPFKSDVYSISGNSKILEGQEKSAVIVDRRNGILGFEEYDEMMTEIHVMTGNDTDSLFASTYNGVLDKALRESEELGAILSEITLQTEFGDDDRLCQQFEQVSKLIKMRANLTTERGVFVTQTGGWDTHNTFDLDSKFGEIDRCLKKFRDEMADQGIWDDVVVMTVSDFGRTLTSNGLGTDHAWGGNHFIAGGSVRGGRVLGQMIDEYTAEGTQNIGRGRVIPTTSWEQVWHAVVCWFGVCHEDDIAHVLPNAANFASELWGVSDVFGG